MRKPNARRPLGVSASALVLLVVLVGAGGPGSSSVLVAGQEAEPLRIDVTLNEYSFAPEPLRIPAGRPVTLVIRNAGNVPHEFMAGREVAGNDFRQDLFADLHVNIEQAEQVAAGHGDPAGRGNALDAERSGVRIVDDRARRSHPQVGLFDHHIARQDHAVLPVLQLDPVGGVIDRRVGIMRRNRLCVQLDAGESARGQREADHAGSCGQSGILAD